jgi:hypothetical protein
MSIESIEKDVIRNVQRLIDMVDKYERIWDNVDDAPERHILRAMRLLLMSMVPDAILRDGPIHRVDNGHGATVMVSRAGAISTHILRFFSSKMDHIEHLPKKLILPPEYKDVLYDDAWLQLKKDRHAVCNWCRNIVGCVNFIRQEGIENASMLVGDDVFEDVLKRVNGMRGVEEEICEDEYM